MHRWGFRVESLRCWILVGAVLAVRVMDSSLNPKLREP